MVGIYRLKPWKDRRLSGLSRLLGGFRIKPNWITLTGLVGGLTASLMLLCHEVPWAMGLLASSIFADLLDGAVARENGSESILGRYLDSISDRLVEMAWVGALVAVGILPWWGWMLPLASILMMLARIWAFGRGVETSFVPVARFERMTALIAVLILPWPLLTHGFYLLVTCVTLASVFWIAGVIFRRRRAGPVWVEMKKAA